MSVKAETRRTKPLAGASKCSSDTKKRAEKTRIDRRDGDDQDHGKILLPPEEPTHLDTR